jgi:hypothetical protein
VKPYLPLRWTDKAGGIFTWPHEAQCAKRVFRNGVHIYTSTYIHQYTFYELRKWTKFIRSKAAQVYFLIQRDGFHKDLFKFND